MSTSAVANLSQESIHLRIVNDLAVDLLQTNGLEDMLWLIAKTAIANLSFEDCVIYLLDRDSQLLIQRAAHGPKNPVETDILNPITIPLGKGIVGQVARNGMPEIVADTRQDPRYILDDEMRLSEIAVPIVYDGETIGVIDSEHPDVGFYTDEHLEILTIIASIAAMSVANALHREQLEKLTNQLHYDASHDGLTGLINRRSFEQTLKTALATMTETSSHVLCYSDINHFKALNDTYGHAAGDEFLQKVARIMRETIGDKGFCARMGGDEFCILMPNTRSEDVYAECESICLQTAGSNLRRSSDEKFTHLSIGMFQIEQPGMSVSEVMALADTACYVAKKSGEPRVCDYRDIQDHIIAEKSRMSQVSWLRDSLQNNAMELHIQEIAASATADVRRGYELLLRFPPGEKHNYTTAQMFLEAERHGFSTRIDHWVVNEALDQLASLPSDRIADIDYFAINLSSDSIANASFQAFLLDAIANSGFEASKLCFELNERTAVEHIDEAAPLLRSLKQRGCSLALDDFGSGHSSFEHLKRLDADIIKIDGNFVRNTHQDTTDSNIVAAINYLAHSMGISTVAEHVENQAVLEKMRELGVDFIQGYVNHQPEPLRQFCAAIPGKLTHVSK